MPLKHTDNERGLTLVEILVGLALLGIVLSIAYSFYFFGTQTYAIGESRSDVQQNARLAADFITQQLRFVDTVEILGDGFTHNPDYNYIYLDGTKIKHMKIGETTPTELLTTISGNVDFSLNFKVSDSGGNILFFEVAGDDGERDFSLETELLLINTSGITLDTATVTTPADGGIAVSYLTPAPPDPVIKSLVIEPETLPYSAVDDQSILITVTTDFLVNGALGRGKIYEVIPPASEEDDPVERILDQTTSDFSVYYNSHDFYLFIPAGEPEGQYSVEVEIDGVRYPYIQTYVITP